MSNVVLPKQALVSNKSGRYFVYQGRCHPERLDCRAVMPAGNCLLGRRS
jgi:hypothetical protein